MKNSDGDKKNPMIDAKLRDVTVEPETKRFKAAASYSRA